MTDWIDYERRTGASDMTTWNAAAADPETMQPFLAHPEDVLDDPMLSLEQKRSILAFWLSDIHAVPDAPRWRQLDNGALVDIHDLWDALRALDDAEADGRSGGSRVAPSPLGRRKQRKGQLGGIIGRKRDDDNDDPPPSPVAPPLPIRPKMGGDMVAAEGFAIAACPL